MRMLIAVSLLIIDILISSVHSILTNRQMLAQKFSNNLMSEEDPTTVFPENDR